MRIIGEPITVHVQQGQPHTLYWSHRRHPVTAILDTWRWAGRWWLHDPPRDYWLLNAQHLTAEIYRTHHHGQITWTLARIED